MVVDRCKGVLALLANDALGDAGLQVARRARAGRRVVDEARQVQLWVASAVDAVGAEDDVKARFGEARDADAAAAVGTVDRRAVSRAVRCGNTSLLMGSPLSLRTVRASLEPPYHLAYLYILNAAYRKTI